MSQEIKKQSDPRVDVEGGGSKMFVGLISLSLVFSKFIHAVAYGLTTFCFLAE